MRRKANFTLSGDQKRVLWYLKTHGPSARSEIASRLDLHKGMLTRLSRELLMLGCIEEQVEDKPTGRGRPMVPLTISGQAGYAAGAMVHPGWVEIALVD